MRHALIVVSLFVGVAGASPTAHDAWIALGPPGDAPRAGYLTLRNPSAMPIALVAVSSPAFAKVELHRSEQAGGQLRMRLVPRLEVPARGAVELAPGGLHLMLFGANRALRAGQHLALVLAFADGTTLAVDAEVRDPRDTGTSHQHGTH